MDSGAGWAQPLAMRTTLLLLLLLLLLVPGACEYGRPSDVGTNCVRYGRQLVCN